jgi:hypothetical protein
MMGFQVDFSTPRDPTYVAGQISNGQWTGNGPWYPVGSTEQMVHIVDLDDAPTITVPSATYDTADCVISTPGQIPPGWLWPACNFGAYFAREDSSDTVAISGIQIQDVDVYETCGYSAGVFVECRNLKVLFKVFQGTMLLNSRTDLNFIQNIVSPREGFVFTATLSAIASAIKLIYYNVDLPQLINSPDSTVLHYNTQNGDNAEYISITVDDQGFSGWSGVLASTNSRINITIVATNTAPVIEGPGQDLLEYTVIYYLSESTPRKRVFQSIHVSNSPN